MVVGEGFEPSKAVASRFTVCPRWPLGYPTGTGGAHYARVKVRGKLIRQTLCGSDPGSELSAFASQAA
jgi:hypothetical protein